MEHDLLTRVTEALRGRRRHKRWMKVVSALACVVVFCTTYALILPAITLEGTSYCGIEEHTHGDTCYEQKLICQLSDEVHTHGDGCYVQQQNLVCTLPEVEAHTHTDACKTVERTLTCTLEESAGHTHSDACKTTVRELTCTEAESDTHTHGDSCYTTTEELTCGLEESAGHTHGDACYTESESITCGKEETAGHTHSESCYKTESVLKCDLEEGVAHVHGDSCYEKTLTCTKEEHEHTVACYSNPKADLETSDVWERTLPEEEELSGVWAEDVLAIAESQLGYTESSKNYQVDTETGDLKGYTRYGAWYGDPYGHWCAMFASFCIDYAGVEDFPLEAGCQRWIEALSEYETVTGETVSFYHPAEEYTPVPGDLIFFDTDRSSTEEEDYADHVGLVVEIIEATETEPAQIKTIEGNSGDKVQYVTYELDDETILGYGQLPEKPLEDEALTEAVYHCGLEEHTHSDECYDADGGLICTLEEHAHTVQCKVVAPETVYYCGQEDHTHTTVCTVDLSGLSDEDRAAVENVILLIDQMPSADEIDATMAEFEEAENYEGEEAWLTEVYQQVAEAYYFYDLLSDELKAYVVNADKLLELEYIWSVTAYSANTGTLPVDTGPVHAVNFFDGTFGSGFYSILIYGGSYDEVMKDTTYAGMEFTFWKAIVVSTDPAGNLCVEKYVNDNSDKSTLCPSDISKGFVLLYSYTYTYFDFVSKYNDGKTIYASVNFDYTSTGSVYDASGVGTISFDTNVFVKKTATKSDAPTAIQSAHTSEFIELNLYDYGSNINTNFNNNKYSYTDWNYATKSTSYYPGFQWNGGAYSKLTNDKYNLRYSYDYVGIGIPYAITDRNVIDSIDFGNSLITDLKYSGQNYLKSSTATDITFFADSGTYSINAMDYYYKEIDGKENRYVYGVNNRPIGLSIASSITDTSYDVLKRTLGSDGYPVIKANNASLAYLFTDNTYATKQNTTSIDGLFLQDSTTGEYYFNSRWNHAQYSNNKFTLYDEIITPNFIVYPFGNFMPFNDITDSEDATQVSKITSMGNYVDYMLDQLYPYTLSNYAAGSDSSRAQLYTMLQEYKENVTIYGKMYDAGTSSVVGWDTFDAADAIADYFTQDGDNPSEDISFLTNAHLNDMYNIDYDVEKDFFFGMEMKMNFYQPKDGMTGNDNGDNNNSIDSTTNKRAGAPDGMPDYPMEFYFTGDDDVWVYIDDVLFLDLSGIHRHVGGEIDFVNGKVYYYALDISTGDVSSTPYATYTFKQILEAAGASTDGLNEKGTFKDYTTHSFHFFYTERGSGSSVCRLNFNFPLLRQNTLAVEKELADDDSTKAVEALGNPDFLFQVLDADNDSQFLPGNWAYSLYDADGSVIQEIEVTEKYQDGRVKTMKIKDGAGNVLCTEEYDSDGNRTSQTGSGLNKVLRLGANGIFALKAGQKAEFVGIPETWGKYYVRELLEQTTAGQYGTITVSGTAITPETITVGGTAYSGVKSPVLDMSSGSSTFRIQNKLTNAQLGSLSISKTLGATYSSKTEGDFTFHVTLDGEDLPEGTEYTLTNADGTSAGTGKADEGGLITVPAGQTATISNIIAGTKFEVTETTESAKGYFVTYSVDDKTIESATGTVGLGTTVKVGVVNSENGTTLAIPVTKQYYKYGSSKRISYFNLVQVTDSSGQTPIGSPMTGSITIANLEVTNNELFSVSYSENGLTFDESGKAVLYYRLTEDNTQLPKNTIQNYQVYVYEVTVTKTADGMSAAITGMWTGTADENGKPAGTLAKLDSITTAAFKNTIVGPLTLSKKVSGSGASKTKGYEFQIVLDTSTAGKAPLPDSQTVTITKTAEDGTTTTREEQLTFTPIDGVETRRSCTVTLYDGESVTIQDIPYNASWSITEITTLADMEVSYIISSGTTSQSSVVGKSATGTIKVGSSNEVSVAFTNTQLYTLPEAGGAGTTTYTMAGLMLMLCSAAYLLYRSKKRRRGAV